MGLRRFKTTTTKLCKTYKKGKLQVTQMSEVAVSFGEGFRIFHAAVPLSPALGERGVRVRAAGTWCGHTPLLSCPALPEG